MEKWQEDWNIKEIEKNWKKLKVPKRYASMRLSLDDFMKYDYNTILSIRETSGKTTQALLLALCCWWSRDEQLHIQYERSDDEQITLSKIQTLFTSIVQLGYIERLTDGKYNNVIYKHIEHKFYMCKTYTDEKGRVLHDIASDFFCYAISLESWLDYKSSVNDNMASLCIFDEIGDTSRNTIKQMNELCDNISTFGRPKTRLDSNGKPLFKIILLGNNTNQYLHWWSEFCVEDAIPNLKFGGYIEKKTDLGTTIKISLLSNSEDFKDVKQGNKLIHFFGFNTPKMNAYNGLQEWQEQLYPHLPYEYELKDNECICRNVFIHHRNRTIQLRVFSNTENGTYIFANYFNDSKRTSDIVLNLEPTKYNEVYGFGDYIENNDGLREILKLIRGNRIYFASNSVGSLFNNYMQEYKKNKFF